MIKNKKGIWLFVVIVIVTGLLSSCSSASDNSAGNSNSKASSLQDKSDGGTGSSEALAQTTESSVEGGKGEAVGSAAGGGFASELATSANGFNQKIIYTASLSMQVDELTAAATLLRNAIQQSGGYILEFQDMKHDGEIGSNYTIKVPAAGFMSFIDRVEGIEHKAFERNIGGKDVSEQYVDLESRLKARKLVEERLLLMMDKAVKADDLLKFSQQLSDVQENIEMIKGKIRYLDQNVSFSTVELRLYQTSQKLNSVVSDNPQLGGRMLDAIVGSAKVVWDSLKLLLVVLAGALPVLIVLAILAVPFYWAIRRKKNTAASREIKPMDEEQPPTS